MVGFASLLKKDFLFEKIQIEFRLTLFYVNAAAKNAIFVGVFEIYNFF